MANTDAPKGFVPLRHLGGGLVRANGNYKVASAYATAFGRGDAVKMHSDGTIIRAAATEVLLGICAGFQFTNSLGEPKWSDFWPAAQVATDIVAYVYDDPWIVFGVQVNGGTLDQGAVGACADIVVGTYDQTIKQSQSELNASVGSGTAQCKILGLEPLPGNAWGANAKVEVLINEHFLKQEAGI